MSRSRRIPDLEEEQRLRVLLDEVRVLGDEHPERGHEIDLALLDLGALGEGSDVALSRGTIRQIALLELGRRMDRDPDGEIVRWLAEDVLEQTKIHRPERRLVAARALGGRHETPALKPMMRAARSGERELREVALGGLVGWSDPAVHFFFLERIERDPAALPAALEHLEATRDRLGPHGLDRLRGVIGKLYVSENWRDAARARSLIEFLGAPRAVPILIESLAVWLSRRGTEVGSRRIQHEILEELRAISGRSMGLEPELWSRWWTAVREGRVELPELDGDGQESYSTATFFGLRPISDRVLFVLDRSGSMESPMGTGGRSRYEEAVQQLFGFLEASGPETRFGIVVFNDRALKWRNRLTAANTGNLNQARRWIVAKPPQGATHLRAGVRKALDAGRDDELDPTRIEADTIIVLCDGATGEGPSWVRPWLDRVNGDVQLVFHCVLIGQGGDGTLETLADRTGGDFVRVGG